MELTREYILRYQQAYRRNRNPSKKTLLRIAQTRERILSVRSGKPPSKRWLARQHRKSEHFATWNLYSACCADWLRRLGVPPDTGTMDDSHWTHLAEEIARWTGVRLSATEIAREVVCTDVELLIRIAAERREEYLDKAIQDRSRRAAAIRQLNPTDRAAANYIGEHPFCTGNAVAKAIVKTGEHFRRYIVPKLKPFGLRNYGGYYMPELRIV